MSKIQFSCGVKHTLYKSTKSVAFAFGSNAYGQLNKNTSVETTKKSQRVCIGVRMVAAGGFHSVILTEDLKCYSFGHNRNGELGTDSKEFCVWKLSKVDKFSPKLNEEKKEHIVWVNCGRNSSFYVSNLGNVWANGLNLMGCLGLKGDYTVQRTPKRIDKMKKVLKVFANQHTTHFVTAYSVFACGENTSGMCGVGYSSETVKTPSSIEFQFVKTTPIKKIVGGGTHTLFLDENLIVYSCGSNANGQLGLGNYKSMSSPKQVLFKNSKGENVENIIDIAAGSNYSLFLSDSGSIWGCGSNKFGNMGETKCGFELIRIPIEVKVKSFEKEKFILIECGYNFSIGVTEKGRIIGFGDNEFRQCGNKEKITVPTLEEVLKSIEKEEKSSITVLKEEKKAVTVKVQQKEEKKPVEVLNSAYPNLNTDSMNAITDSTDEVIDKILEIAMRSKQNVVQISSKGLHLSEKDKGGYPIVNEMIFTSETKEDEIKKGKELGGYPSISEVTFTQETKKGNEINLQGKTFEVKEMNVKNVKNVKNYQFPRGGYPSISEIVDFAKESKDDLIVVQGKGFGVEEQKGMDPNTNEINTEAFAKSKEENSTLNVQKESTLKAEALLNVDRKEEFIYPSPIDSKDDSIFMD